MLATIWLMVVLVGLFAWTLQDNRQYACFKAVEDSAARRAFYRRWTVQSFVFLTGASAVTLLILGRSTALIGLPAEFQALAAALSRPARSQAASGDAMLGMTIGFVLGLAVIIAVQVWRIKKMLIPVASDVEALIPRNTAERLAVAPLCLNAGFSEELFFRLALPLLIAHVTGSTVVGIVAAIVLFGSIHAYQGWKGVVATTLAGAFLTFVYFKSGSLLRPMVLHATIDTVALIVRPWIVGRLAARAKGRVAVNERRLPCGGAIEGVSPSS